MFSVVTNLSNDVMLTPRRSLDGATIGFFGGEMAIKCPTINGMSGGPVLRTMLWNDAGQIRRMARPFATVFGAPAIFDNAGNFIDLKALMSRIW